MRAWLHLAVSESDGTVVAQRHAHNTVMASGAQLIADLFSGAGGPITHMGVGTSDAAPEDVEVTGLENQADGDVPALTGATVGEIPPEAFTATVLPERRVVQVRVRGTLPADAAVGRIREAGLVSMGEDATVLYNRVVFAPVDKHDDHELTLFWEIDFPFGDLQWLN